MSTAIEFDNIGKQYRLGLVSTQTLSHDLKRWWAVNVRGKEDPYLRIGETNDRTTKGESDYVWALKDINFKIEQGDVVGIIGRNGAGKSTLLKLLSRVTAPTTGEIRSRGRIGSLLEVGTGFHPEMTGRENIFMNGAIMGMTRHEIARKLDDIVDFSGCSRYLDTPVKRYSSGMTVRLGFAVAAFLEPEILVVDEVLAVGDAEFQKKAIGKMKDVSQGEGRTVLFVSHNMESIKMLCDKGVLLNNGGVELIGTAEECVNHYVEKAAIKEIVSTVKIENKHRENFAFCTREIEFVEASMLNDDPSAISNNEPLHFVVKLHTTHTAPKFQVCVFFQDVSDTRVSFYMTDQLLAPVDKDIFDVDIKIPNHCLPKGRYSVRFETNLQSFDSGSAHFDFVHHVLSFEVKYIHQGRNDEFLFWNPTWGKVLGLENQVISEVI